MEHKLITLRNPRFIMGIVWLNLSFSVWCFVNHVCLLVVLLTIVFSIIQIIAFYFPLVSSNLSSELCSLSQMTKKNSIFWNIKMYFSDNHCLAIPIVVAVLMYVIWLISIYAINAKVRFPLLTRYGTLFDRVCRLVFPGYFGYIHIKETSNRHNIISIYNHSCSVTFFLSRLTLSWSWTYLGFSPLQWLDANA